MMSKMIKPLPAGDKSVKCEKCGTVVDIPTLTCKGVGLCGRCVEEGWTLGKRSGQLCLMHIDQREDEIDAFVGLKIWRSHRA